MQDNKIQEPIPAYCLPAVMRSAFFQHNINELKINYETNKR